GGQRGGVAGLGLAKGVGVAVVRIAGRGLVHGVSDKGVSLVAELSGQALDEVVAAAGGHPDTSGPESEAESGAESGAELHSQLAQQPGHRSDARSTTHAEMGPGTGL